MIVRIELKPSSKGEEEANYSKGPIRRHTREYSAWSNDRRADENDILNDGLCPRLGSRDPHDRSAHVERRSATRSVHDDVGYKWDITTQTTTDFTHIEDPTQEPAHVDWSSQRVIKMTPFDRDGKAVLNAAGDVMVYPATKIMWVASISKDCTRIPPDFKKYENAVNRSSIIIDGEFYDKETINVQALRVGRWNTARVGTRSVHYRTVTFQLIHDEEGWMQKLPNVGFNELRWVSEPLQNTNSLQQLSYGPQYSGRFQIDPATGELRYGPPTLKKVRITYPDGSFPTQPEPLTRRGAWIRTPRPDDLNTIEVKPQGMKLLDLQQLPGVGDPPRPRGAGQIPSIGGGGRR